LSNGYRDPGVDVDGGAQAACGIDAEIFAEHFQGELVAGERAAGFGGGGGQINAGDFGL